MALNSPARYPTDPQRLSFQDLTRRAKSALGLSAPSWATPWRARAADDEGRTGPRIAVIGNCQARGVAQAMRLMAPSSPVRFIQMAWMKRDHGHLDGLAATLAGYDHVFTQLFPAGLIPGGDSSALHAREPRLVFFPTVVFPAFHPDMVYVGDLADLATQKLVPSPMGQYHSAIALAGFRAGLSPEQTRTLFREDVFARLGYLDAWDPCVRELLSAAAGVGFGLEREVTLWARRGSFMHVINHPKGFVIGDIARRLLGQSGLKAEPVEVEDYLGDELARDVVWPIYPPVADVYGLTGSYLFKTKPRPGAFPHLYDLPEFLARSHAIYAKRDPASLGCTRVEAWLATPEIAALFADARAG